MEKKEKRLTITLYENDVTELKMEALRQGTTLKRLIESVLKEYMKDKFVPPTPERYYDTQDLSLFLRVTKEGLTEHYRKGNIKGIKFRNEWYSNADQVKEFLNNRKDKK